MRRAFVVWAVVTILGFAPGSWANSPDLADNLQREVHPKEPFVVSGMPLDIAEKTTLRSESALIGDLGEAVVGARGGVGRYLGSRALDFCDMMSFDAGIGLGVQPHFQVTRFLQVGIGGRWHGRTAGFLTPFADYKREWGGYRATSAEFSILPLTFEFENHGVQEVLGRDGEEGEYARVAFGSVNEYRHRKVGFNLPSDPVYADGHRDFWAITFAYGAALIIPFMVGGDATADLHPTEVVDFLFGLAGIDLLDDDLSDRRTWQGRPLPRPEGSL